MSIKNNKSLGQHWLKDRLILDEIASLARKKPLETLSEAQNGRLDVSESRLEPPKTAQKSPRTPLEAPESRLCLEIGPGLGTLTSSLLRAFPRVLCVEFDQKLAENLPRSFPGKNLEVVNADFLQFDLSVIQENYVVAGNIPYYITSPIIDKLLSAPNLPDRIVLLVQKEVAKRIAAAPGKHTFLSLGVQNRARVTLGPVVEKEYFTPPPKVDSQVIVLDPLASPQVSSAVMQLIKRGFSAPRKKLIKNLGQFSKEDLLRIFSKLNISKDSRPADLTLADWQALAAFMTVK